MRLLIFTQKIDKNDPTLGFFCDWVKSFASKAEFLTVICLEKGEFDFPKNVTVYSLGKEVKKSKLGYVANLYHYLFLIHGSYDKVFVHMNEEYVILAGLYWKLVNIQVYLWRNHPKGGIKTRISVGLSTKVFCTSTDSFTARYKKTVIMPVGVNTSVFRPIEGVVRKKYSVCAVGRVAPIKNVDKAIEAVNGLILSGAQISLSVVGSAAQKDFEYYNKLKKYVVENNLSTIISFVEAVNPSKLPEIYSSHEICLNLTESGSFDKTIVEATACGVIPLVSNHSFSLMLPKVCITEKTPESIASSLGILFDPHEQIKIQSKLKEFVDSNNLDNLSEKLFIEIKQQKFDHKTEKHTR